MFRSATSARIGKPWRLRIAACVYPIIEPSMSPLATACTRAPVSPMTLKVMPSRLGSMPQLWKANKGNIQLPAVEPPHADFFAFKICWRFDVMAYGEGAHQSFDERGDENAVESIQNRP